MKTKLLIWTWMFLTLLPCLKAQALINSQDKANLIAQEWHAQKDLVHVSQPIERSVKPAVEQAAAKKDYPSVFEQKISLRAQDMLLDEALKPLVEKLKMDLILGPGVENKKINVDLNEVSILKALNTILYSLGYDFKIKDGSLVILAVETRIFRVVLPPVTQDFSDLTSNESSSGANNLSNNNSMQQQVKLGTKIQVSNESSKISYWDDVKSNLDGLISKQGTYSINKPAGVVVVTDAPQSLQRIEGYFEDLNSRVSQQIEVDVKVVEVNLNDQNTFGVDWNALAKDLKTFNSLGLATNFASENFTSGSFLKFNADGSKEGSGISKSGISLAIDALSKQGNVEVVSQPKVRILNNQVAVIQVGSTQTFLDKSSIEVTQTGTITSVSTSQVQEGVTMRFLANIVGDQIFLSVTPVVTTIDNIRSIVAGNTKVEAPTTTTKSINTLVKVKEGETVAIGGLMTSMHQKNEQSVPVLSKIPLLGKLFQYSDHKNNKSELIIFITPRKG